MTSHVGPSSLSSGLKLKKRSKSQIDKRLALLSMIVENANLKIKMLEEEGSKSQNLKVKIESRVNDIIVVNNLFTVSSDLEINYCKVSKKIKNHPKLFDQEDIATQQVIQTNSEISIDNILNIVPERVIFYKQRGFSKKYDYDD